MGLNMQIVKYILFIAIFFTSIAIGRLLSKKYVDREKELKEMKNALNIFKSKIKFTYEPIGEVFMEISQTMKNSTGEIFNQAKDKMKIMSASKAWEDAVQESKNNLIKEDKQTIKTLSKLLGQTDIEGQINQIEITQQFLQKQIELAEQEREKNEKLYKKLVPTIALAIIVILF